MTLSLYSVQAILFLDDEGHKLVSKYYTDTIKPDFEKSLFAKSRKVYGTIISFYGTKEDILFIENHIVVYRNIGDVFIYVVGSAEENELLLESVLSCLTAVLQRLIK